KHGSDCRSVRAICSWSFPSVQKFTGRGLDGVSACREPSKRFDPRKEKVSPTPDSRECRQTRDLFSDWTLGDFEFERAVVIADDGITLIGKFMKVPVVH